MIHREFIPFSIHCCPHRAEAWASLGGKAFAVGIDPRVDLSEIRERLFFSMESANILPWPLNEITGGIWGLNDCVKSTASRSYLHEHQTISHDRRSLQRGLRKRTRSVKQRKNSYCLYHTMLAALLGERPFPVLLCAFLKIPTPSITSNSLLG